MKTCSPATLGVIFFIWLSLILGCVDGRRAGRSYSTSPTPASSDQPLLELLSFRGEREYSFISVRGEVKNITSEKLENVTAIVEFRTANGELVKSEEALIEYNPLMPGQTSPFRVMGSDNPEIKTFHVNFKELMGGTIAFKDSTSTDPAQPARRSRKK